MTTRFKLCLAFLPIFMILACGTTEISDDDAIIEKKSIKNIDLKGTKDDNRTPLEVNSDPIDDWNSEERFYNRMQWVSYMAAQVLLKSPDARALFRDNLNDLGIPNVVSLTDLLGPNVTDLSFRNEFVDEFLFNYYHNGSCGPGRPSSRPLPPGHTTGGFTNDSGDTETNLNPEDYDEYLVELYIDALLNRDCLEFYLPHGFAFLQTTGPGPTLSSHIKSTGHPLNTNTSNLGFNHITACTVNEITVDDSTNGLVLLVRPRRSSTGCLYEEYSHLTFEDFLD